MKTQRPVALLLSRTGRGKSTFYNKICNQQRKTEQGGFSVTQDVELQCTKYGEGFLVMDTPGFGCCKDISIHLSALFAATELPLNAILVLTKYCRWDNMIDDIQQALSLLSSNLELVIVIITHWDQNELLPKSKQQEIKDKIYSDVMVRLQIKTPFICSSINTSGELICKQLDSLIKLNKSKVALTPKSFHYKFAKLSPFDLESEIEIAKLTDQFKIKCQGAIQFINKQSNNSALMADLMHELIILMKEEAQKCVVEFVEKNRKKFDEMVEKHGISEYTYLSYTKLKESIVDELDMVIEQAQNKMQTYKFHVYNYLKQCPYCGLIWMKVNGCGNTYCGNKPEAEDDQKELKPLPKTHSLFFKNEQICVKQNSPLKKQTIKVEQKAKVLGCGKPLNWDQLPQLSEDLLQELKESKLLDFISDTREMEQKDIKNEQIYWNEFFRNEKIHINNLINQLQTFEQKPKSFKVHNTVPPTEISDARVMKLNQEKCCSISCTIS